MNQKFALLENLENLLPLAFAEDGPDVTTQAIADLHQNVAANITAKAPGVICGLPLLSHIFTYRMTNISVTTIARDGDIVHPGMGVATVEGSCLGILAAERTALNFVQHLSGIATLTRRFVSLVQGTGVVLLDTRKTTPGWRYLEKYAVRTGGAVNNRLSASDAVMIKDNHIAAAKGLGPAVKKARDYYGEKLEIVVEVRSLDELREALALPVHKIMLDNFDLETARKAVAMTDGRVPLEVTGGVNLQNIREFAGTGVKFISIGALTHSAPALDLSLSI